MSAFGTSRAFDGSEDRKAICLASFHGSEENAFVDPRATSEMVATFADQADLPQSLVTLLRGFALTNFDTEARTVLGRSLIDMVPVGADCATLAERWVGWSLLDPYVGPASIIEDPEALALMREIATDHLNVETDPVTPAEWRRLRKATAVLHDAKPQGSERAALSTLAEGCWDFGRMPGTAMDCFLGWLNMQGSRTYAVENFTLAELNEFADRNREAWLEARKRIDETPDYKGPGLMALNRELLIEMHPDIGTRGYHVMDRREEFLADAIARGRQELARLLREAAANAHAP